MKNKKRILMLNYEFPPLGGGASPVSYEIAKGYVKLGHSVDVVTMGFQNLKAFEVKDGINIYRVKCLRTKKEICHPWEQLTYIISAKKFLKQHMKTHSYDINHTHFIIPTGVISLWLKKHYNLPYIITSHGSDVLGYNKRFKYLYPLLKSPWKKIIKEARTVITPSQFLQDEIKKITQEGNFIVIPNGIDLNKFKPLKKENRILVVARLFENKGVQDILDALNNEQLKQELKEHGWKVDIVGEGPYREFLEKKANENQLNNLVTFHGWIDNNSKQMKDFYGKSKIFISASYFESFGLTLLEAMSAECLVISSDIPTFKEIINNKEFLFSLGNPESLSNKLKLAISSKEKNKDKSSSLNKKFAWSNIILNYERMVK